VKILIVGTGVIGTIYGWALDKAGLDITHLVRTIRPEILQNGFNMDVLDERRGFKKYNQTNYKPKVVDNLNNNDDFHLVLVPTNWYQTETALNSIVPKCKDSFFYILTSNWTGTEIFDRIITKGKYILGYPDGGGTIKNGLYWTNIGPEIHIAEPDGDNLDGFDLIQEAFTKASIKLDVQKNMLHWLWVHNAGSTAISLAFQKHKNVEKYLHDKDLLKKSFLATRECLDLCEKRGAYSNKYPEIAAFKWPMWLLIPIFKFNFRHNESMKRYTAHGESMPLEDIAINYSDILSTAEALNYEMPNFLSLEYLLESK
jgi:ketopantoate reductase